MTWLDAALIAGSLALGVLLARTDPSEVESRLGLTRSMAPYEQDYRKARELRGQSQALEPSWRVRIGWTLARDLDRLPEVLCMTTLGVALATFRHPRALGRRSMKVPGVLATSIAAIVVPLNLGSEFVQRRFPLLTGLGTRPLSILWSDVGTVVAVAILAAWSTMALGGYWRAQPHARDRLGRVLGCAWLLVLFHRYFLMQFFLVN